MSQMLEEKNRREEITRLHPQGMNPQFIVKAGYIDPYPEPVSICRPVGWFIRI